MLTAIQEIIEHFTFHAGNYSSREEILSKCKELLEKEKQQIMDAYKAAITIPLCEESQNNEAEEYYTEISTL